MNLTLSNYIKEIIKSFESISKKKFFFFKIIKIQIQLNLKDQLKLFMD